MFYNGRDDIIHKVVGDLVFPVACTSHLGHNGSIVLRDYISPVTSLSFTATFHVISQGMCLADGALADGCREDINRHACSCLSLT